MVCLTAARHYTAPCRLTRFVTITRLLLVLHGSLSSSHPFFLKMAPGWGGNHLCILLILESILHHFILAHFNSVSILNKCCLLAQSHCALFLTQLSEFISTPASELLLLQQGETSTRRTSFSWRFIHQRVGSFYRADKFQRYGVICSHHLIRHIRSTYSYVL